MKPCPGSIGSDGTRRRTPLPCHLLSASHSGEGGTFPCRTCCCEKRLSPKCAQSQLGYRLHLSRCGRFVLQRLGVSHINLLLLDVEGAELGVLRSVDFSNVGTTALEQSSGMLHCIARCSPNSATR